MPVTITGSRSRTLTTDADNDSQLDSGDQFTYEVIVTNSGDTDALDVELDADQNGYTITNVKIGPIGVDDDLNNVYGTVAGNTPLTFNAADILGNDLDPDDGTPSLTVTHINGTAFGNGAVVDIGDGTLTNNGDGTFTFRPDAGFEGEVNFTYDTVDSDGIASVAATPGSVNITVSDAVWYVDSTGGSDITGNGTFENPFASLNPLTSGGSSDALDDAGDTIFVYANGANAYNSGIVLESGQILRGEGVAADYVVNGLTISSVQTDTQIEYSTFGVELNQNNTILGIDLVGEAATAVAIRDNGGTVGNLNISDVEIDGIGQIIDIDNGGALNVTFQSVTSHASSGVGGVIDLDGVTGSFTVTGFTTMDNGSGTHNQVGIDIGGTVGTNLVANFAGGTSLNMGPNASAAGVNLGTNAGSTNFAGLAIATQTANGFVANNAGTLTVTGAGNSVTTTTGQILSITNTLVGATDVSFNVLSASGVVTGNAITLSNVDNNDINLSNVTLIGASGATGDGINVNGGSSTNVLINTANINNTAGDGIEINASTGTFQIVTGNIGNLNDPAGDTVRIIGGTGAVDIDANLSKSTDGHVVEIDGHSGGTINFGGNITSSGGGNDGILLNNNSGNIEFSGGTKTINTANVNAVTLTNNNANVSFLNGGLDIDTTSGIGIAAGTTGVSTGGTLAITGTNNDVSSTTGSAIVMNGTDVGASGITLERVDSNGAVNSIWLANTGSSGSFNITGTGTAGTGGTINNSSGDAIELLNVNNFNLAFINVTNTVGHVMDANNLGGSNTINGVLFQYWDTANTATKNGLNLVNNNTNTTMIVTNSTFDGVNGTPGAGGNNDGILVEAQGTSAMNFRAEDNVFTHMFGDGIQVVTIGGATGTVNVRIIDNDFTNAVNQSSPGVGGGNGGISLTPFGGNVGGSSQQFTALVQDNVLNNVMKSVSNAGAIGGTNGRNTNADITILNNTVTNLLGGRGITFTSDGGDFDIKIDGNTVQNLSSLSKHAINVNFTDNGSLGTTGAGDVTISNNIVGVSGTNILWPTGEGNAEAILVSTQGASTMNALISTNTVRANTNSIIESVRAKAGGTSSLDVTITNNNVTDTVDSLIAIDVTAGFVSAQNGTLQATITGNNVNGGIIQLTERNSGNLLITQASQAAVTAANTNVGATNQSGTGVPTYNGGTPTLPADPILPPAFMLADPTPPAADTDTSQDYGDDVQGNDKPGTTPTPTPDPEPQPEPDTGPSHPVIVDDGVLSQAELDYLVEAAIQRWIDAGASEEQVAAMRATEFSLADMNGNFLASSEAGVVRVDTDGAGRGWFLDGTPGDDDEYEGSGTKLTADAGGAADGKMDLLTVLMHELGHQVGLDDSYAAADSDELMYGYAQVGTRRLPGEDDLESADLDHAGHTSYVVLTPTVGTLPAGSAVRVVYTATINNFVSQVVSTPFSNNVIIQGSNFADVPIGADSSVIDTLSLGDQVFIDLNSNGVYDSGTDTAVQNVAVSLYADNDDNGTPDGAAIATDTTDASGLYRFDNLAPGTYIVAIDASNFTSGGALEGRLSIAGGNDPDTDTDDNDDNGVAGTGTLAGAVVSAPVTLVDDGEAADDGTGDLDYNNTVDFGFLGVNAEDDDFNTDEDTPVNGDVLADNGNGADSGTTITAVNGNAGDVGNLIVLPSGAELTLNSDGTFTYDPNDAFDETPTAGSGASNTPATDSFTYELDGGDTATVTITIAGLDSDDELQGTAGDDVMSGGIRDDQLFGLAGNDQLFGNAGRDHLDGGTDTTGDAMTGGAGHDTYVVDSLLDTTVELANQGRDHVLASLTWTLADHVDDLTLTSANPDNGTGNDLPNAIVGNNQDNTLTGLDGNDTLKGNGGADILIGGLGSDRIFGGAGIDDMQGGAGSDVYNVDDASDTVTEAAGEGNDRVETSVTYTIGDNIEDLTLLGAGAISGTGNGDGNILTGNGNANTLDGAGGNDIIYGLNGADTLIGGVGEDILKGNDGDDSLYGGDDRDNLFGGAGADGFYFETLNPAFRDKIRDFDVTDDTIFLDTSVFTALSTGTLDAGAFVTGTAAGDADDRIIYDSVSGNIYYDADGNGAGGQILFANVTPGTGLTNLDFVGY